MKSKKRQVEKDKRAEARKRHGKPGDGQSKYGLKHREQMRGYFSDTSPSRFGKEITEPIQHTGGVHVKEDEPAL